MGLSMLLVLPALVVLLAAATPGIADDVAATGGIILNEDNSHFFLYRPAKKMTAEGMREFVDQYADTQVKRLLLCVNGMKVNYDTKAEGWEPLWANVDDASSHEHQWIRHVTKVHEAGIDPYAVFIERCREIGVSPWISMRMNIFTWTDEQDHFSHSSYWKQHPEYWRLRPERSGLDYNIAAVRQRAMTLVRELLERYDLDGLELDWMRIYELFTPGEEATGGEALSAFMADVCRLTDQWAQKRGHPIQIGVRVPVEPETAAAIGLDGVAWAKAGLIDLLVPAPYLDADFDIPVERWRQLLGPAASRVTIAPCLESDCRGHPDLGPDTQRWVHNRIEALRGFAASMLDRGADEIYLFNYFDPLYGSSSQVTMDEYMSMIRQAGRLETIIDQPRRHVVTSRDVVGPGERYDAKLPVTLTPTTPVRFDLHIGPKPTTGRVHLRVVLAAGARAAEARLTAHVNGSPCQSIADLDKLARFSDAVRITQFDVPLSAARRGYNALKLGLAGEGEQKVLWVEICVKP